MADLILQVHGGTVRFGGVTALDHVDLAVRDGQVCGLIGPNGAGKTTLFNTITRLCSLTEGAIHFEGRPLERLQPRRIAERGIARTFQNLGILAQLTVLENVLLGAHHRFRNRMFESLFRPGRTDLEERRMAAECMEILGRLGLSDVADAKASSLPYGTLKKVEIARALAARPRLLLLDEPAAGLTHGEVASFGDLLRQIRESFRLTIILVEHHMGLVSSVCDHVVALHLGRKIAEGSSDSVRAHPQVVSAYLGRAQ